MKLYVWISFPQAAEAAASLGLAAKAQKRKAPGSVPLPKTATIGSSPILYTQPIVTAGENKRLLHASVFSKSILSCGKVLFLMFLLFIHSPTSSWKCLLGDDNCSCTTSATESIVPPMPVLPPQPPPPAPQPPSALEPMSKVLTDKTKKQKKEKVDVFCCFFVLVVLSLFFFFFFCCYSFICLVFCFGDLFSICVWFASWVCIGLVFWCFWVSYPFFKRMRFLEKFI